MSLLKTAKEIKIMAEGGQRLGWVLSQILQAAKPGTSLKALDQLGEKLIKEKKGQPSFKMVEGYRWATCLNINQGVVHGVPSEYCLKKGDLLSVDLGIFYKGFHTDMAKTIQIGGGDQKHFLEAGRRALKAAIKKAKPGHRVGHLSAAIEKEIRKGGFSPVKSLTGHGIGRELHEEPRIPCFLKGKISATPLLKRGMTLAIEVIYTQGRPELILEDDNWTVEAADGKPAGLFEQTIVVDKKGGKILTPYLSQA